MNKLLLTAVMAGFAVATVNAEKVSQQVATDFGRNFIDAMAGGNHTLRNVEAKTDQYYVINFYPQGWAIISADDCAAPVIGYSPSGSLQWHSMPDNMRYILSEFSQMVDFKAKQGGLVNKDWRIDVQELKSRANGVVEPLIRVNWNQTWPYNKYCPGTGNNQAIVGCVAVSMSQAMSVQRYPASPKGKVSYACPGYGQLSIDFDYEVPYQWDAVVGGFNNYDEAARLMYHAGMSVSMGYGPDASGIPSNQIYRISDALVNNFGYSESEVKYYYRDQQPAAVWSQLVNNELYAGRAVIYNAIDPNVGGHSFNIDGIDAGGLYHLNWGWGGQSNGYFTLDNLRDPYMNFSTGHRIVIGVGNPNRKLRSLNISGTKIEANLAAGAVLGVVTVNEEEPSTDMNISVYSREGATLPFVVDGNLIRTTRVLSTAEGEIPMFVKVEYEDEVLEQGFRISITPSNSIEETTRLEYNRAMKRFTLTTKHNVTYTLADANGAEISSGSLEPIPTLSFSRDDLSEGTNTLTLVCGDDRKVIKIINSK